MSNANPPGDSRIAVGLRTCDGTGVARIEDRLDTDIDDLWSAFVDPDRLNRWLGDVQGDLRPGGEFRAHFWASDWEGSGRIAACEPPHHLLVIIQDTGSSDEHCIEAWLQPDGEHTMLVVEERGMPLDLLAAYGAGIQIHVEDLGAYLAGGQRCNARSRWQELIPSFRELAVDLD